MTRIVSDRLTSCSRAARRNELLVITLVLTLLLVVFFHKTIFLGYNLWASDLIYEFLPWKYSAPEPDFRSHNPIHTDVVFSYYPWIDFNAKSIRAGRVPLWNPYSYCGVPHMANYMSALFYPVNVVYYLMPLGVAVVIASMLRLFVAGLFTYLLMRRAGARQFGATVSAIAFTFNGVYIAWLGYALVNVAAWLPAIFYLTVRLCDRRSTYDVMLLSLVTATMFLGGHPATCLHILSAVSLYLLVRVLHDLLLRKDRHALTSVPLFALAIALGLGLAAIQILPFWEYLQHSAALALRSARLTGSAFVGKQYLVTAFVPDAFGHPGDYWGNLSYSETNFYVGIITLILAAVSLMSARNKHLWFFVGLLVISTGVVYGIEPIHSLITQLPLFKLTNNLRMSLLVAFSLCIMAGFGADTTVEIATHGTTRQKRVVRLGSLAVAAALTLFIIFWLVQIRFEDSVIEDAKFSMVASSYFHFLAFFLASWIVIFLLFRKTISHGLFKAACMLVLVADLFSVSMDYNQYPSVDTPYPGDKIIEFLQRNTRYERILGPPHFMLAHATMPYELFGLKGYDALEVASYQQLFPELGDPMHPLTYPLDYNSRLFDLVGVKYFIWNSPVESDKFQLVMDQGDLKVYENKNVLERCFVVSEVEVIKDKTNMLERLKDPDFDLRRRILLEEDVTYENRPSSARSMCEISEYTGNRVAIDATLHEDGFVFLSDVYFPGWEAYVDGSKTKLYRADYTFRAVPVTKGRHRVEFVYRPRSYRLGRAISLGTAALIFLYTCATFVHEKARERTG